MLPTSLADTSAHATAHSQTDDATRSIGLTKLQLWPLWIASITALPLIIWSPLTTYVISLACFGFWHITAEMRYVWRRFYHGQPERWPRRWWWGILSIIGIIAGFRALRWFGLYEAPISWEPYLLSLLLATSTVLLGRARGWSIKAQILSALSAAVVAYGTYLSPMNTLFALAIAHNATPVAFIWERLQEYPTKQKYLYMGQTVALFLLFPMLLALGLWWAIDTQFWMPTNIEVYTNQAAAWSAYLSQEWQKASFAPALFRASVWAQILHYTAVIYILPKSLPTNIHANISASLPTEAPQTEQQKADNRNQDSAISAAILICIIGLLYFFTQNFSKARGLYGIAAAVHAWIELPLLAIAITGYQKSVKEPNLNP